MNPTLVKTYLTGILFCLPITQLLYAQQDLQLALKSDEANSSYYFTLPLSEPVLESTDFNTEGLMMDNMELNFLAPPPPLPLTLLQFVAVKNSAGKVELTWKTAQEINVSHFSIEKSVDGKKWSKMGNKPARNQQGVIETYNFTDNSPGKEANYYRLHVVDYDYKSDYSPVRMVSLGKEVPVRIYPTLARPNTTLYVEGISPENAQIEIFDYKGQMKQKVRMYSNTINLPNLSNGIYQIRITNTLNNSSVLMQKILII